MAWHASSPEVSRLNVLETGNSSNVFRKQNCTPSFEVFWLCSGCLLYALLTWRDTIVAYEVRFSGAPLVTLLDLTAATGEARAREVLYVVTMKLENCKLYT
jgi:hypothetical protein